MDISIMNIQYQQQNISSKSTLQSYLKIQEDLLQRMQIMMKK